MNVSLLYNSVDYLINFNLVVSLSKHIYKSLKPKLLSDNKFISAITRNDIVIADYLSKYVIHNTIIPDRKYFSYEVLNVCKKAKLLFTSDLKYLTDTFQAIKLIRRVDIIFFILDNFDININNNILYCTHLVFQDCEKVEHVSVIKIMKKLL